MVRLGRETVWFFLAGGANELKKNEAGECFEPFGEVAGIEKGSQMLSELVVMKVAALGW
jgi:hypothetical protein